MNGPLFSERLAHPRADAGGDACLVVDRELRVVDANEDACELLGRQRAEIVARPWLDYLSPLSHQSYIDGWVDTLIGIPHTRAPDPVSLVALRPDGTQVDVTARFAALATGQGKQVIVQLTPSAGIQIPTTVTTEAATPAQTADPLAYLLERSGDRAEQWLEIARLSAGQLELQPAVHQLDHLVLEAVEASRERARSIQVHLQTRLTHGLKIEADVVRFPKVLASLVDFAVRRSPPGSSVEVEAGPAPGGVVVALRHGGAALSPEQRDLLDRARANPDVVADAEDDQDRELLRFQGIIELHGGRLWFDGPAPGRLAGVSFFLPVRPEILRAPTREEPSSVPGLRPRP